MVYVMKGKEYNCWLFLSAQWNEKRRERPRKRLKLVGVIERIRYKRSKEIAVEDNSANGVHLSGEHCTTIMKVVLVQACLLFKGVFSFSFLTFFSYLLRFVFILITQYEADETRH